MKYVKIPQMEPSFDKAEADAVYRYMISGGWVTEYKKTEELEKMIAQFVDAPYCVMTTNGTISLILALLALDIRAGDEVLVPDFTMIATANVPVLLGIKPVLVDIEPHTLCMDLEKAALALTPKTKALVYVPLNGRSGNMKEIRAFCKIHKLFLIEDAAQSLGSYWHNKHLGAFGKIGCFSFSTQKIITTGQGGAVITNNKSMYIKIKQLKDFGKEKGGIDIHNHWGWNFKFTDLQAIIGIEQMKKLPKRLSRKKEIYARYHERLRDIPDIEFIPTDLSQTSPWFIDIYIENPDQLGAYLSKKGIETRKVYPSVHTQKIYRNAYRTKHFPVSQHYASRGLWLPSSSRLSDNEIDLVIMWIRNYYS